MIIRSQDKRIIANLDNCMRIEVVECDDYFAIGSYESTRYARLGQYSTEEKALKVLDMICEHAEAMHFSNIAPEQCGRLWGNIFNMPQDSEV